VELGTLLAAMGGVAVLAVPTVVAFAWFTSFTAINLTAVGRHGFGWE